MNSPNTTPSRTERSPNGCNAKPVMVALMPSERTELENIAASECRSMSATSRMLMLLGLVEYRKTYPDTKSQSLSG